MKLLKKLATLFMALTMCLGLGLALTACGDNEESSSSQQNNRSQYSFTVVKADTTPAVGYKIQLCKTSGECIPPVEVQADGIAKVSVSDTEISYVIHVVKGQNNQEVTAFTILSFNENESDYTIPANYQGGAITVIITE